MSSSRSKPDDLGHAVHYAAVEEGTPMFASDDVFVGEVVQVVDNYNEHILDGMVIDCPDGEVRFVDGPEVSRTFENAVFASITAAEVEKLGPPEKNPRVFGARRSDGFLSKLFGPWQRK